MNPSAAAEALLGAEGLLASLDPRFEPRPQQGEMAGSVARALEAGENLVVEAPTGVGKSLAYLLPAALWAAAHGRRVLVSTYTRALQEQIVEKDLPVVAEALRRLGHRLDYAMLQGSDNYLCAARLRKLEASPELFSPSQTRAVAELSAWARTAQSGHRASLPVLVPQGLWARLARDPELCPGGPASPAWGECLYRRDRERAERSQILVVNHALLLSGARLPDYDALIVDEAHNLEETAVSRFGVAVSRGRVQALLDELKAPAKERPELAALAKRLDDEALAFFAEVGTAHGAPQGEPEPGGRLLSEERRFAPPAALKDLEDALLAEALADNGEGGTALKLLHGRAQALRRDLEAVLAAATPETARWVDWGPSGLSLRLAPLEVGSRLAQALWGRGAPVVLTSATLSGGQGLKEFRAHVGLDAARELTLDSPFDYPTQAGLLLVDGLPEPSEDGRYAAELAARCRELIDAVPGGLLILFSSWKTLRAVHAKLRRAVKGRPLWMQGDTGAEALVAEFTRAKNAVLLGVDTFWQGVDMPGEALSCVVLTKLPFPNFGSPIEEARRRWFEENGRGYFEDYSLPRAVMKFRQGFGRLIRSTGDRGAVVVLDSRILHRGYGRAFLEALPRCRKLSGLDDLSAFLKG